MRPRIFLDTEFTGLFRDADLMSIALVAEDGRVFYAEFTDYSEAKTSEWIHNNVVNRFLFNARLPGWSEKEGDHYYLKDNREKIAEELRGWFAGFGEVEIWADCPAYDWVFFCDLFDGAFKIPKNVYYVPFDLMTLLRARGLPADLNREEYVGESRSSKHNALHDARVSLRCYKKVMSG